MFYTQQNIQLESHFQIQYEKFMLPFKFRQENGKKCVQVCDFLFYTLQQFGTVVEPGIPGSRVPQEP